MKRYFIDDMKEISEQEAKAIQEEQMKWLENCDWEKLLEAKFIIVIDEE